MMTLFSTLLRLFFRKKPAHVLVLFQNNYELRGSGGFLTQLLDVTIGGMRVSAAFRHDYLELKPKVFIQTPPEIQKYLGHKNWHLRDANIFGDFDASGREITSNYQSIFPVNEVAGVFAVNFSLVEKMMKIIGPVRFQKKIFDEKNIFSELSSNVSDIDHHNLQELNERKNILKSLYSTALKACVLKFWKWPQLAGLLQDALQTKDLQLFFTDSGIRSIIARKGLIHDHSNQNSKDFLSIVENNYLGLKSNRYLRRTVFHDVVFHFDRTTKKLSDAFVHVKIEWKHCGHYNYPLSGTYQSLAKISIPSAAQQIQILHAPEQPQVQKTAATAMIVLHQILPIQESSSLEFSYRLPAELFEDDRYSFNFIKQSGVAQEHVHETVRFPDQYRVNVSQDRPSNLSINSTDNVAFVDRSGVDRDYGYECGAELHNLPPRIFYHEMVGPNKFQIRFNEPVFPQAEKFAVKVAHEAGTKMFQIEKTEFEKDHRHLIIHTKDIPQEEEKFYKIFLSGLVNSVGTPLGERSLTAIYRSKYFSK